MKSSSRYYRPALFAGLILSIVNFAPGLNLVNCFCCAGLLSGGMLAVLFYKLDLQEGETLMNIDGFYLGLWTGIFAAGFETVLNITIGPLIADVKMHMFENLLSNLLGNVQIPQDMMDQLKQAISAAKNPGLIDSLISFFLTVMIYSVFTIFGALLTSAFIQKREKRGGVNKDN
ncbi:MAG: hypothetical protein ACP5US_01970 [Candidatus Kryptoniota bacterium]